jgi:hypothetical protein
MRRNLACDGACMLLLVFSGCCTAPGQTSDSTVLIGPVLLFDSASHSADAFSYRAPYASSEAGVDFYSGYTEWVYDQQNGGRGYYNDLFIRTVWARRIGAGRLGS